MNFKDMRIGTRMGAAFGAVLVLAMVLAVVGVTRLDSAGNASEAMDQANKRAHLADSWHARNMSNDALTEARLRASDAADAKLVTDRMSATSAAITRVQEELAPLVDTAEGKAILVKIADARRVYVDTRKQVFALQDSGADAAEVRRQFEAKMKPLLQRYDQALTELAEYQRSQAEAARAVATASVAAGKRVLAGAAALALALGMLCAWWLTRSITVPLRQAVTLARTVAGGDLSIEVRVVSNDETGELMAALKAMTENLNRLVARVRTGTDTIATAAGEVAAGNQDLSSRTEQQASSLEETASSMEELTGTVQQNAENARQGNQLAVSASGVATRGGAVVAQVVDTMGTINDSSRKIVDIIAVIDGIAFQTNILALNAAVEAARAGEQGRGFAVVATEVRNLAQRSSAAAREIRALIDDSVQKVDAGTRLVGEAGATMQEVVDSVRRVTDIMAEIAAASGEQSEGIEQVNQAVGQMDQVTQQNAALVEEAAAATESMQEQARALAEVVSAFKLDQRHLAPPAATAAPALACTPVRRRLARPAPALAPAQTRHGAPVAVAAGPDSEEF